MCEYMGEGEGTGHSENIFTEEGNYYYTKTVHNQQKKRPREGTTPGNKYTKYYLIHWIKRIIFHKLSRRNMVLMMAMAVCLKMILYKGGKGNTYQEIIRSGLVLIIGHVSL